MKTNQTIYHETGHLRAKGRGHTTKEVANITGVKLRTLHDWAEKGVIKASVRGASGRGSSRLYSLSDLVEVSVYGLLTTAGFKIGLIKDILNIYRKRRDRK